MRRILLSAIMLISFNWSAHAQTIWCRPYFDTRVTEQACTREINRENALARKAMQNRREPQLEEDESAANSMVQCGIGHEHFWTSGHKCFLLMKGAQVLSQHHREPAMKRIEECAKFFNSQSSEQNIGDHFNLCESLKSALE